MITCPNCGSPETDNAKFCGNCGGKMIQAPSRPPIETPSQQTNLQETYMRPPIQQPMAGRSFYGQAPRGHQDQGHYNAHQAYNPDGHGQGVSNSQKRTFALGYVFAIILTIVIIGGLILVGTLLGFQDMNW